MNTWLVAGLAEPLRRGRGDSRREPVGSLSIALPDTTFEVCQQLHGSVSSLAEELPGTLAPELEVRDQGRIEEHHRLGIHAAILDDAKRQYVHARLPGELGRRHLLRHQRMAKRAPSICTRMSRS